jgi:hypothetical protein
MDTNIVMYSQWAEEAGLFIDPARSLRERL